MFEAGSTLGSYCVLRALASGGMSDALLARSPAGQLVVLKVQRNQDPELAARLRDEARLGARIYHPRIVETLDAFEHEGMPVLVLGYVEGPTLDDLRRQGALGPAAAARLGCQVAEALGAVHDAVGDAGQPLRGLHRDVTARNIVVRHSGDVVLIDLGIAKSSELRSARTETGMVVGTLRYLAPEVINGIPESTASDFYSLGCVIIEACSGLPVFSGTPALIAASIVTGGPLAAHSLPAPLHSVVERMVSQQPGDRLQAAHEVASALRAVEEQLGGGQEELARRARACVATEVPRAASGASVGVADLLQTGTEPAARAKPTGPWPPPSQAPPLELARERSAPAPLRSPPSLFDGAPLELASVPRARPALAHGYRELPTAPPRSGLLARATPAIVVVALLVVAALAWRWREEGRLAKDRRMVERQLKEETALLQRALADTPLDCSASGGFWLFHGEGGTPVIVDAIGKVPRQHRQAARCVTPLADAMRELR